jgi:hypothetical protein
MNRPNTRMRPAAARRYWPTSGASPKCCPLLAGDGPGVAYGKSVGWACTAHDRRSGLAVLHAGAVTC